MTEHDPNEGWPGDVTDYPRLGNTEHPTDKFRLVLPGGMYTWGQLLLNDKPLVGVMSAKYEIDGSTCGKLTIVLDGADVEIDADAANAVAEVHHVHHQPSLVRWLGRLVRRR